MIRLMFHSILSLSIILTHPSIGFAAVSRDPSFDYQDKNCLDEDGLVQNSDCNEDDIAKAKADRAQKLGMKNRAFAAHDDYDDERVVYKKTKTVYEPASSSDSDSSGWKSLIVPGLIALVAGGLGYLIGKNSAKKNCNNTTQLASGLPTGYIVTNNPAATTTTTKPLTSPVTSSVSTVKTVQRTASATTVSPRSFASVGAKK